MISFTSPQDYWHISTPENHPIIFTSELDFKAGMSIFGIAAALFPLIGILTFELMSNHIHVCLYGPKDEVVRFMTTLIHFLQRYFDSTGRTMDLSGLKKYQLRHLSSADEIRNVITYDNRNGFVVNADFTPFSYPWGANKFFFNPDAVRRFESEATSLTVREIRALTKSRRADKVTSLKMLDGYVCPLSFCDITTAMSFYRNASNYFYECSRNIEAHRSIAADICERVYYTDNELFRAVNLESKRQFGDTPLNLLNKDQKVRLAKMMHYDFNATKKQISRLLRLDLQVLDTLFPSPA